MKKQNNIYILIWIYIALFDFSLQIKENSVVNIENLPFNENKLFKLVISYPKITNSKDTINIKIESKTEDLNDYYYRYYNVKSNQNNVVLEDIEYCNEYNKTLILSENQYIICEMKHKINSNKIYLKSESIHYNVAEEKKEDNEYIFYNKLKNKNFVSFSKIKENNFSIIIFFSTFCSSTTISIILILFDLKEDKKIVKTYNLCTKDRAYQEYNNLKNSYINKNIFKFAFFLMKYTYPIFNIITIYNYDHPRYIRFFILLIKMMLNIFISMEFFLIHYKNNGGSDDELIILCQNKSKYLEA